jgi:hypothetical protein
MRVYSLEFAAAAAVALLLALTLPVATTVFGLILFGILHNFFELRYVIGRFGPLLGRSMLGVAFGSISAIVIVRLVSGGAWGAGAEVAIGFGLVGLVLSWRLWRRSTAALVALLSLVAGAAALALSDTSLYFVVLAHLHNIVPLCFLWEWSRDAPHRGLFRAVQLGWVALIPLGILLGGCDGVLQPDLISGSALAGSAIDVAAPYTPPLWRGSELAMRMLTLFAFLQTMHYFTWCVFFPRVEPSRGPALLSSRAAYAVLGYVVVSLAAIFIWDYSTGRSLYLSLAAYHAYLEYPVLLILILGGLK